jgi:hypothetical protein
MPNHVTHVVEICEAGILLKIRGKHVVRVLGALQEVPRPTAPPSKEEAFSKVDSSIFNRYYSGELAGQQQDPSAKPYHPRVPAFFITRKGEVVFLERDWS